MKVVPKLTSNRTHNWDIARNIWGGGAIFSKLSDIAHTWDIARNMWGGGAIFSLYIAPF